MRRTCPNRRSSFEEAPWRGSLLTLLASVSLCFAWFGCQRSQPVSDEHSPRPAAAPPATPQNQPADVSSAQRGTDSGAVKAEFRNVMFHLTPDAAAHLETVSGELWPAGKYDMPVFDDKASFELHVANGTVSIKPDALATIMNEIVFAHSDAPMKDISIRMKEDRLLIKGKLHSKGDLPFETAAEMSVNADGRLRLHTEKVKALKVPVKEVMALFGIDLANLVNTSKIPGLDTDKNDLILDLGVLLPPPHIRGRIASARLESNLIVLVYGEGGKKSAAAKPEMRGEGGAAAPGARGDAPPPGNYMAFRGHRVKFGKLTMENTDLMVIDLDPQDPLDWDQDRYQDQLVAGYSKSTATFGLRAYAKDIAKLSKHPAGKPLRDSN